MKRFSWLQYVGDLFGSSRTRGQLRARQRPLRTRERVESLEERWLLSGNPLDDTVLMDQIAPGMFIQRTFSDAPETQHQASGTVNGPVFGGTQLNGNGLQFHFNPAPGMPQFAIDGFQEAADLWSAVFTDDIVVNINIDYLALPFPILGSTNSIKISPTYSDFRTALAADMTSADDATAVAHLQAGPALTFLLNRTSDSPNGSGSATPFLDNNGSANNTTSWVTRANAKAVGLLAPDDAGIDASISFTDQFAWDFDRSDGISANATDFVGVAAHEIGHALGFVSGVDILDGNSPPTGGTFPEDAFTVVTPLDLYRYSPLSLTNGPGVIDFTADTRPKSFSIDGGANLLTTFSTGYYQGDGNQASHWEDDLDIGIMDPTAADGELLDVTDRDKQAFDAIGWDVDAGFGFLVTPTSSTNTVVEGGATDSYTLTPRTPLNGTVDVTVTADSQTQVSKDGTNFFNSVVLTFADQVPQTITVKAIDDTVAEGNHTGTITHHITASTDPDYTTSLNLPGLTTQIEDNELGPFQRVEPLGSLISVSDNNTGHLAAPGAIRDYTFFAEAGSTFAAVADPEAGVTVSLQLLGLSATVASPTPGSNAVLPSTVIPADGIYTVRVSGSAASQFKLTGYRNAALESAIGDSDDGNELPLGNTLLPVGSGRLAVVGNSAPIGSGPLQFNQNIDPSLFIDISTTGNQLLLGDDDEQTIITTVGNQVFPAGAVTVGNNGGIIAGANADLGVSNTPLPTNNFVNALLPYWDDIDDSLSGGSVYWQELLVNGINTLIVQWNDLPHFQDQGSATFELQLFEAGPVLVRYAYQDVNFNDVNYNFGQSATVGYQQDPTNALMFSFNSPIISNGSVLDLVPVNTAFDVDEYTVDLTGKTGQPIDVVLAGLAGADFTGQTLELLAPNGTVLATAVSDPVQSGDDATNFDLAIQHFVVPADGVYTLRLTSSIYAQYSMVVTEGMGFEAEDNNDIAGPLRDLADTGSILGYLNNIEGTGYSADFSSGDIPNDDGWTIDNSGNGLWHVSSGRSNTPGHSGAGSMYFGTNEGPDGGGTFNTGLTVAGNITSPVIDLTTATSAQLSFNYFLDTENLQGFDRATVEIATVSSGIYLQVEELAVTNGSFVNSGIDLTPYLGQQIHVRFSFDSGDQINNNFEGWYVDDVLITGGNLHPSDIYAISAQQGQLVIVSTETPFDNANGSPVNSLDPELQAIHFNGVNIMASDQNSAPDGKNAYLSFIAPATQTYYIKVIATSGTGEYVLHAGIDVTPPAVTSLSPADDSINVGVNSDLTITFDKAVFKGSGNILLKNSSTDAVVQTINVNSAAVVAANNQITIDLAPLGSSTGYYVVIPNTAFTDANGNAFAGYSTSTAWNFTTADVLPPVISNLSPADDATNVNVATDLTLTFNEAVVKGAGTILVKKSSDGSTVQTIDVTSPAVVVAGSVVTVDIANLSSSTSYFIQVAAGTFKDSSNNAFTGIGGTTSWNFTTGDFDPPLIVTLSPADNAIDVAVNSDLVLTFNEAVIKGTGNILIKKSSDDSTVQTINVTSPLVTVAGSIVTVDLALLTTTTGYYVQVPSTAFRDTSNNAFAGFNSPGSWNFVTSNNQVPTITTAASATVAENTSVATVVLNVDATDLDVPAQNLTYALSGPDAGRFNIDSATGEIRFAIVPDFENPTDQGLDNVYNMTVTVTDNGTPNLVVSQALTITVTAVNDNSPVVIANPTVNVPENTATSFVILNVDATDADLPVQGLSYSLSGTDATAFNINTATGEIRFNNSPNFEAPTDLNHNNVYDVIVTVTDNGSPTRSTSQPVSISVTNVNDNTPAITSVATATVPENTLTSAIVLDVNATDEDLPPQTLGYSLSGPDAGAFNINGLNGEIRFVTSPDFEAPDDQGSDHVYHVTVTVTDNGSPALTAIQDLTVTVTPVNDNAPLVTTPATASIPENSAPGTVVLNVDATDADQPGQSLSYTLTGPGAAFLNIDSTTGEITFAVNLDYENPFDANGDNVYEATVVVTDSGTPSKSTTQNISLTVTPVNDNTPVISSAATASVPENTSTSAVILDVDATDADQPTSNLTYSLSGPDAQLLAIDSATGKIQFVASPDYELPLDQGADHTYNVTVTVSDNDGISRTASQALTITVTPLNDNAPIITSGATATLAENSAAATILFDVNATDADLPTQALSYTLSGPDAGLFGINQGTGVVTFLASPNFEHPLDQDTNNVYKLIVNVADSGNPAQTISQALTVTVTNVNETPSDLSLSANLISENQPIGTLIGSFSSTDVDAGDTFNYSLVTGPGSADNSLFAVIGGQLRSASIFDFEARSSYSIRVRTTDAGGLIFEKPLTVTITDADDAPTDLNLSSNVIAENQPTGSPIGSLSTIDQDPADTFTYLLVAGPGGEDNSSFTIVGDQIQTTQSFNFEAKTGYNIRVRATDSGGLSVEKTFSVSVVNVNEEPTNITLTKSTIAENQAAASAIGSLITTDQDNGDSFTYELVSGPGSEDNSSFTIFGGQLLAAESFNFESRSSYSIRVRSTDHGGLVTEKALTIGITNLNEQPTLLSLSATSIPETQAAGFTVGTFSTTDFDTIDTFTYSLILGTGSNDNNKFEIVGNELRTTATFDFETRSTYSIRVRSRDSGGLFVFGVFTINVTNADEAPLDVTLAPAQISENQPANSLVGSFNTTDADTGDSFTYSLVPGAGSANNASFAISGGQLRAIASLNFEAQSGFAIRVRSTDSGGLTVEKAMTVNVANVNEAPTDIGLSGTSVAENLPVGTVVGNLSSIDTDANDSFTYALVSGAGGTDNSAFTINNGQLQTAASFDFETKSSYSIRIRSTDAGGLSVEKTFVISVIGVDETPTDMTLTPASVAENLPSGTVVGSLTTTDPDGSGQVTYTFVAGLGSQDNASFVIGGNQIKTTAALNFESRPSYSVRVRGTDAGGLSIERVFTIAVTNVNEAPATLTLSNASIAENQPANTEIGTFDATDPDSGEAFTYSLVSGAGSVDNAAFLIMGDRLLAAAPLDFESKASYSIRVRVTDAGGLSVEDTLTINVTNQADPPIIELTAGGSTLPNGKGGLIDTGAKVSDQDSTNFEGNRLVMAVQPADQLPADRFRLVPQGKGAERLKATKTQLRLGKTVIGTVSGGRSGVPLTITFTQNTTVDLVQQVVRQLSFKTHGTPGNHVHIDYQIFDGSGKTSGPVTKDVTLE